MRNNGMKRKWHVLPGCFRSTVIIFLCVAAVLFSREAAAIPSADFRYAETSLGGGLWQYDYTLFNTSDPVLDAGYDVYDIFISFSSSSSYSILSYPAGWDPTFSGPGFIEVFSDPWGSPPGQDVIPGASLAGFSFLFDYRVGDTYFEAYLTNPVDAFNPVIYNGTTSALPTP